MQSIFNGVNIGLFMLTLLLFLIGLTAVWHIENLYRKALGLEIVLPGQSDAAERIALREHTLRRLKRRWAVTYIVQVLAFFSGGFLLIISVTGLHILAGLGGALTFMLCIGLDNSFRKGFLHGLSPDPLERAERHLEAVFTHAPASEAAERISQGIVTIIRSRNLTLTQKNLFLAHLSGRDDLIGKVAKDMAG